MNNTHRPTPLLSPFPQVCFHQSTPQVQIDTSKKRKNLSASTGGQAGTSKAKDVGMFRLRASASSHRMIKTNSSPGRPKNSLVTIRAKSQYLKGESTLGLSSMSVKAFMHYYKKGLWRQ